MTSLCLHGTIRIHSLNVGTSPWKEGSCEVIEKDDKFSLVVQYKAGGAPAKFPLNQNIKTVILRPMGKKQSRLMVNLKDTSSLTIDKIPCKDADELKQFLDSFKIEKAQTGKPVQGSGSFGGVLVNRSTQKEVNRQQNQTPSKRVSFDKDEASTKSPLNNFGRTPLKTSPGSITFSGRNNISPTTSTPHRSSLMENRCRSC
ncbi:ubiquitin carboxyl-terminal hydrolase 37-like [Bombina bombina]|uniref:ubiquitin carboxyl-terminal hydrolase 37-like n=1 Tax=Bombina bombina TaxID=8345 RepID=UPI00235A916E|nr:ubiquitin carboxyl-terminal hydrolase 37-like [Bombina bombina]